MSVLTKADGSSLSATSGRTVRACRLHMWRPVKKAVPARTGCPRTCMLMSPLSIRIGIDPNGFPIGSFRASSLPSRIAADQTGAADPKAITSLS